MAFGFLQRIDALRTDLEPAGKLPSGHAERFADRSDPTLRWNLKAIRRLEWPEPLVEPLAGSLVNIIPHTRA
jgi:hypothetical protein